jgi:hypothetical protein
MKQSLLTTNKSCRTEITSLVQIPEVRSLKKERQNVMKVSCSPRSGVDFPT